MKALILAFVLALGMVSSVSAHSPVTESTPADGDTLAAVPENLTLTLADPGRFMRVEVTHTSVDGAVSDTVDLDIPSRDLTNSIDLPAPDMGPGTYLIEWRVLGEDGHALDGTVTYMVEPQ